MLTSRCVPSPVRSRATSAARTPLRRSGTRDEIGDRDGDREPKFVAVSGELEDTTEGLDGTVGRGELRVRAVGTEPGDRAVDQTRVAGLHVFVADPEPRGDAGPIVLEQHIRDRDEVVQHLPASVGLEVEDHAAPVTV
jgi:hypothetical protein